MHELFCHFTLKIEIMKNKLNFGERLKTKHQMVLGILSWLAFAIFQTLMWTRKVFVALFLDRVYSNYLYKTASIFKYLNSLVKSNIGVWGNFVGLFVKVQFLWQSLIQRFRSFSNYCFKLFDLFFFMIKSILDSKIEKPLGLWSSP